VLFSPASLAYHLRLTGGCVVRLVFLGKFGDVAPADLAEVSLPPDVHTLKDLQHWLARQQPLLGQAMAATPTRLIVNQCVTHDLSSPVADGDEVAFLPPMSGG
jgi:molybdopterin converting factor small subunit